jgi:hypothetical protein
MPGSESSPAHDQPAQEQNAIPVPEALELPEDVYARILEQVQQVQNELSIETAVAAGGEHANDATTGMQQAPAAPATLEEAGISIGQLSELILKLLYLHGTLSGFDIGRQIRLPFSVLSESLDFLKTERCIEVSSGELVGPLSYRFLLTDRGRSRSREAFASCRYVGPAPVSLEHYTRQCRQQSVQHVALTHTQLEQAFADLVIDPELLHRLGPAVCSGQAIFLYGSPGNGKTVIAKGLGQLLNRSGGTIFVPYSVAVDNQIIAVFDPTVHRAVEPAELSREKAELLVVEGEQHDKRWRQVLRPVVIAGGELSLEMLDLRHHRESGFYTAPIQLKANGGVFLIDDFGRQLVPARELLNRWILPLEERSDYLTLATGKKFAVPFEQLTIFSTNLRPDELVDAAFLRRIRHKIEVGPPSEKQFREIFRRCCESCDVKYDDWIISRLLSTQYAADLPPKASDPRDLMQVVAAICRFRGEKPHLSERIVFEAFQECLGGPRLHH